MPRAARPSDVYRLPEHTRPPTSAGPPPGPPTRRFPVWVGVAGVLAAALIISGLVRGATEAAAPGNVPLVDVVSEDQAIAALRLFGAQAATINALRERTDIYANPGPRDAAQTARRGAAEVDKALAAARNVVNPQPLLRTYVQSHDHPAVARRIAEAASLADTIAVLASAHDTLYSGTGSIPLEQAYTQLSNIASGGAIDPAIDRWARALLLQMEDRNRVQEAVEARAASQQVWADTITALRPAAVAELQTYLGALPPVTVQGLRGHPVAGPGLRLLEQDLRKGRAGDQ